MAWFGKTKRKKKKQLGAVQVTPQFTADRFFVYLVGGAATLAGLYVIWTFIKKGLEKDNQNSGSQKAVENGASVGTESPLTLDIPTQKFPIRYEGFNPLYKEEVAQLQKLLVAVGQVLPIYGVDGRFGPETLAAVQKQFGSTNKTQVERGEFIALQKMAELIIQSKTSIAGLGSLGSRTFSRNLMGLGNLPKYDARLLVPTTKHQLSLGSLGCGCGCNQCNH